jgi:DNA-directed RNA polymerase subunit RPC12/RpoP
MNVKKISCPSCGANLEVQEDSRLVTCQYCGAKLSIEQDRTKAEIGEIAETNVAIQLGPVAITGENVILPPNKVYPLKEIVSAKRGELRGKFWHPLLMLAASVIWTLFCSFYYVLYVGNRNVHIYSFVGVIVGLVVFIGAVFRLIVPRRIHYLSLQTTKWGEVVALRGKRRNLIEIISKVITRMAEKKRQTLGYTDGESGKS